MKPKSILRISVISIVAVACISFLENIRQTNNKITNNPIIMCADADKISVSNNDFIFFQSISKYLVVSFTK